MTAPTVPLSASSSSSSSDDTFPGDQKCDVGGTS